MSSNHELATSVTDFNQPTMPDLRSGTTIDDEHPAGETVDDENPAEKSVDDEQPAEETIKIGSVNALQDFFEADIARQLNRDKDADEEISESAIKRKISLTLRTVSSIIFPSSTTLQNFLPFTTDYLKTSGEGKVHGPISTYMMVNPNYRSAEVVIRLSYKTRYLLYDLGHITFSYGGIPEGAKPTADVLDVTERTEIDGNEVYGFRFPVKCGSIHTTILGTNCVEAIKNDPKSQASVDLVRKICGQINDLKKKDSDECVLITCRFQKNPDTDNLASRVRFAYANEANLHSKYLELFAKAPKSQLLTKDGFAILEDSEPEPPMSYFLSSINRKVALGYGSAHDFQYEQHQAEALADTKLRPLPLSSQT